MVTQFSVQELPPIYDSSREEGVSGDDYLQTQNVYT